MFWNTFFFLSSKHERFRCFPEKTRVRLWFPSARRGRTGSARKWNRPQLSHSIAVGMILLCHPRFPSSHPGSSVMAKLIKSLLAFQRSGIGPDYLYFFPSLWTPVSKVLRPFRYRARPRPRFLVGPRTLVVFLRQLLCLGALGRAVLAPSLCPLPPSPSGGLGTGCARIQWFGVLGTAAHPGKQLSGRKRLLLLSKFL